MNPLVWSPVRLWCSAAYADTEWGTWEDEFGDPESFDGSGLIFAGILLGFAAVTVTVLWFGVPAAFRLATIAYRAVTG